MKWQWMREGHLLHRRNPSNLHLQNPYASISSPRDERSQTQLDFISNCCSGIGLSVISRCSSLWEKKVEISAQASLQHLLKKLLHLSPGTIRRFWRVSALKPEDVLVILLDCPFDHGNSKKVGLLWELFNWAADQRREFTHLPQSCKIMVSMLTRAGLLTEADHLLRTMEDRGVLSGCPESYCEIIEKYVKAYELEISMGLYKRAMDRGLVLSKSCYQALLDLSIRMNKTQLASRLYTDMTVAGYGSSSGMPAFEFVIGILCKDQKIQEARNLLKQVMGFGIEPSCAVLNKIADGYCEKMDYDDLLNFLIEWKYAPDAHCCNKIISSQCRNLGAEYACLFLNKLEALGFVPDDVTFGILISWSCREGKLKDAFIYLSELLGRRLEPNIHAYNALISAMFKEGLGKHAKDVFYDMVGRGISADLSTFRVLLAGYCKDRKFDEVKLVMGEMVRCGHVSLSPLEGVLSKAFMVLGIDPLRVKVKRDNDVGHPRAEFFDTLGNGLYLETDIEEFERTMTAILYDALSPNLDHVVVKACHDGDIEMAMRTKNEMVQWGQKLSLSAYTKLLKRLCASHVHIDVAVDVLEETMEWCNQLDQATLNLLIQAISKKEMIYKAKLILAGMLQRDLPVESGTYMALIMGFCKEGNMNELQECWELAKKHEWLPGPKECRPLVSCLCKRGMLKRVLELFETMVESFPYLISNICDVFLKELCVAGFTSIGHTLVEEVLERRLPLDHAAYYHLIRGFCKEKKFSEALGILDIILEKNMAPCVNEYKLLIPQLCRSNRLDKAMSLKEVMLSEQSAGSTFFYNGQMNGLCKTGKVSEVALELQKMMVKGVCLDNDTFNIMLCGYCQENNFRSVWELLGVLLRKNASITIYGYRDLVRMMCMQGRVHNALSLKDVILREDEYPYLVIYNIMIFYLFQMGRSLLVTELLGEMHKRGLILDQVTYNFLTCGYFKCKDVPKSVEMLKNMIGKNLRPSSRSFRIVIGHLCGHGGLEKALQLSRMMELRGWVHGSVVQTMLVVGLLSYGRLQEAELFLSRMEAKGLIPDNVDYNVLIKRFCGYGRLNKAVDLLNVMLMKGSLPSEISYNAVVHGFCICKAFDQALVFHTEMLHNNLVPSVGSCEALVHGLCADGKAGEAERLLDIMHLSGQTPTRDMYRSVINRYCSDNNIRKASELLHQMQQNGHVPDFRTHWSLISNLSNAGDKDNGNGKGFLSQLLSQSGFPSKHPKVKGGKPTL
ncbi:pentatricopeptide repeat-containing protein At5g15280, mitochondrial [Magnolia sinica]|uniref:pentatricopeptide repeat-containing protein At5g15280, mitochondrial n=1 Tax=Magnolia sinica TaxID=86752 RepID=UPI0026581FDB|nr:pentatricopeptide repeat-containing protein At5g15280, mitochondrial [Magnolia sinica]